jgi:hypothetical protein
MPDIGVHIAIAVGENLKSDKWLFIFICNIVLISINNLQGRIWRKNKPLSYTSYTKSVIFKFAFLNISYHHSTPRIILDIMHSSGKTRVERGFIWYLTEASLICIKVMKWRKICPLVAYLFWYSSTLLFYLLKPIHTYNPSGIKLFLCVVTGKSRSMQTAGRHSKISALFKVISSCLTTKKSVSLNTGEDFPK